MADRPAGSETAQKQQQAPSRILVVDDNVQNLELLVAYLDGLDYEIMTAARICLVCSGTATLETAFCRTPMAIVYRTSGWHRYVVPFFLKVKRIGLVNIVGGGDVVPEFLKFDDNPAPVAAAALKLLQDSSEWEACRGRIEAAMQALGPPGSFDRAAEAVLDMVGRR